MVMKSTLGAFWLIEKVMSMIRNSCTLSKKDEDLSWSEER